MVFDIHYLKALDGSTLTYGQMGSGDGLPIVFFSMGTLGFQEYMDGPRGFFARLGRDRPILYPAFWWRDEAVARDPEYAWEHLSEEVLAAAEAAGFDRFAVVAESLALGAGLRLAAEAPLRVACLVAWSGKPNLREGPTTSTTKAVVDLREADWETHTDTIGLVLAGRSNPGTASRVSKAFRQVLSREQIQSATATTSLFDATPFLERIVCPTLVVHRRDARLVELSEIQHLAAELPSAALRLLDGDASMAGLGPPDESAEVILSFVEPFDAPLQPARADDAFRTILFTDVEDSTDLVVQHGDDKYRALLAEHERLVREALAEHGGNEIKTIGDSFMCWFSSASSALDAAASMQRKIKDHYGDDLRIRIGIHAGEPIQEADGDLYGTSVVRASRIMGHADGGQILVSQVVMDLVEGKSYLFSDTGEFALKGYEHAVHLFEVAWEVE